MRFIKMLGLAMLAVAATMAFVGAGTASASNGTILCHLGAGTQGHCPSGSLPYTGTILTLKGGSETLGISLFQSGTIHIECETEMHGTVNSAGGLGTKPHGEITSVKFENCKSPTCKRTTPGVLASAHNLPWLVSAAASGNLGDGTMTVTGIKGDVGGLFTCHTSVFGFPVSITCGYSTASASVSVHGHLGALGATKLLANAIALQRVHGSDSLCAEKSSWTYLPWVDPSDLSLHLLS